MNKSIFFIFLAIAAISCNKKTDTDLPVITIISPASGQMFSIGDSATISFTITDADLHEFGYAIVNTDTDVTLFEDSPHTHGNVSFNQKFKLPGAATQLELVVEAEDHNGNSNEKSVSFHTM